MLDDDHENNCSSKSCRSCICSHIHSSILAAIRHWTGFENVLNRARADEAGSGSAALLRAAAAAAAALKELAARQVQQLAAGRSSMPIFLKFSPIPW